MCFKYFVCFIIIIIIIFALKLLLSRFSHVRLCATPWTAAHQSPPSLGFSRQEHWSGLPFPSPVQESESEVAQSCPTPSDPMDCSLPGSSIHGIFQARVLEWAAIAFSRAYLLDTHLMMPRNWCNYLPLSPIRVESLQSFPITFSGTLGLLSPCFFFFFPFQWHL